MSAFSSPPPSPYRNEADALRERKETLEGELARLGEQTSHLEGLRARQVELERELMAVRERIGASAKPRRALPLLERVEVASPCNASWDEMVGDERVRFCLSCEKNVFNLSAMPAEDAERLLDERTDGELCVRFYKRADGTIMTSDCPVGAKRAKRAKLVGRFVAVAGAGAMALAGTTAFTRERGPVDELGTWNGTHASPPPDPTEWTMGDVAPEPPTPMIMGTAKAVVVPPAPPPPPPKHVLMGRRATPPSATPKR